MCMHIYIHNIIYTYIISFYNSILLWPSCLEKASYLWQKRPGRNLVQPIITGEREEVGILYSSVQYLNINPDSKESYYFRLTLIWGKKEKKKEAPYLLVMILCSRNKQSEKWKFPFWQVVAILGRPTPKIWQCSHPEYGQRCFHKRNNF